MTSLLLAFFSALIAAITGLTVVVRSQKRNQQQRELRRKLIQRIELLPIPAITQALGINFIRYLYSSSCEQLHQCVETCESCASTELCLNQLACREVRLTELDFCPIRDQFAEHS